MAVKRLQLIFANLLYGETLAPRQILIHIGTKNELCVLKFFRENVLQAVGGGGTNAGNTSPSVAQRPGKAVFWHLDIHPGEGLQYSGAHGASEDRGAWLEGWVEMRLDVFSVIIPDRIGASSRLPTFLKPLKVCKVRLVTKLPPPLTGAKFSCFPIISPSY